MKICRRYCLFVIEIIVFFVMLYCYSKLNFFCYGLEEAQVLLPEKSITEKYTDSDFLYDETKCAEDKIHTIRDYSAHLWGVETVEGNDSIVHIIPKEYFKTICDTTFIGKEYGFYIKTSATRLGYVSDVFVFDVTVSVNTYKNEFAYTVEPLFVYRYQYNDGVITVTTDDKPNLSREYFLTNVSYGFTVFNENSYNSQDEYGYCKETDRGPVILQTRYNSNGYDGKESASSFADIGYIAVRRIGTRLPVVGEYVQLAVDVISIVNDTNAIKDLFIWEDIQYKRDNELNTSTFKDKSSYALDEPYLRTSVLLANDSIVYMAGAGHYSQGILLLSSMSVEEAYRICENIRVNIAKVDLWGNVTIVSSGDRQEYSVHNDDKPQKIKVDENALIYTLPFGKDVKIFTPEYTGKYIIGREENDKRDFRVYQVNQDCANEIKVINDIYFEKGNNYLIEIKNNGDDVVAKTINLSLNKIEKESVIPIVISPKGSFSFSYRTTEFEILKIKTTQKDVKISNIIDTTDDSKSLVGINMQSVDMKFFPNHSYVIEVVNTYNAEVSVGISLDFIESLPQSVAVEGFTQYYTLTVDENDVATITFSYNNVDLGLEIFDENFSSVPYNLILGNKYTAIIFESAIKKKNIRRYLR